MEIGGSSRACRSWPGWAGSTWRRSHASYGWRWGGQASTEAALCGQAGIDAALAYLDRISERYHREWEAIPCSD